MVKILIYIFGAVVIFGIGLFLLDHYVYNKKQVGQMASRDYKNISYQIEGENIELINGVSEVGPLSGAASKTTTRYFGNEAMGDLNHDGILDITFLLTQDRGGSGTFYYVVVALKKDNGYMGTNAIFLGDRIAPQTTEIRGDEIIVNYADRKSEEAMTVRPSIGVSRYLTVSGNKLMEVSK